MTIRHSIRYSDDTLFVVTGTNRCGDRCWWCSLDRWRSVAVILLTVVRYLFNLFAVRCSWPFVNFPTLLHWLPCLLLPLPATFGVLWHCLCDSVLLPLMMPCYCCSCSPTFLFVVYSHLLLKRLTGYWWYRGHCYITSITLIYLVVFWPHSYNAIITGLMIITHSFVNIVVVWLLWLPIVLPIHWRCWVLGGTRCCVHSLLHLLLLIVLFVTLWAGCICWHSVTLTTHCVTPVVVVGYCCLCCCSCTLHCWLLPVAG